MYFIVLSIIILIYLNCVYNRKQSGGGIINYCKKNKKNKEICIGIAIIIILLILLLIWLLWPSDETTPSPTPTPSPISTSKTYCELNSNPCENGGKCISNDLDSYICDCYDDFYGDRCELKFDDIELDSCYDHFDDSDCEHGVKDRLCHGRYCNREHCCRHHHSPSPSPGPPSPPSPSPSPASLLGMNVDAEGKVKECTNDSECLSKVCDPDTNTCLIDTKDKKDTCYYISASNVDQDIYNKKLFDTSYPVKSNKNSNYICPFGSTEATVEGTSSHKRLCDPYNKNCETINKRTNNQNKFKTFKDDKYIRKPSIAFSQKNDKKNYKVTTLTINSKINSCWELND